MSETAKQHLKVSKAMWDIVDKVFDPVQVLTREGYNLIQTYSIKAAHPVLPYVKFCFVPSLSLGVPQAPWAPPRKPPGLSWCSLGIVKGCTQS